MKRAFTLFLTASSLLAQAPVYNFNFYNGGTKTPVIQMDQNGIPQPAPVVAPLVPQTPTVVAPAPKAETTAKTKRFGFEFGGGLTTSNFDEQLIQSIEPGGSENTLTGSFSLLVPIGERSAFRLGASVANSFGIVLKGVTVGFQSKGKIIGPLSILGGVQVDYLKNKKNQRSYAGVYAGPQINLGDMYISAVAQAGYGHNKFNEIGIDSGNLEIGGRVNVGFMF